MSNQEAERDFFKLLLLAAILNQPKLFLNKLTDLNFDQMFRKARQHRTKNEKGESQELQFYKYHDWIMKEMAQMTLTSYNRNRRSRHSSWTKSQISFSSTDMDYTSISRTNDMLSQHKIECRTAFNFTTYKGKGIAAEKSKNKDKNSTYNVQKILGHSKKLLDVSNV